MERWEADNYPFECLIPWPDYAEEIHPDDDHRLIDRQELRHLLDGFHIYENIDIQHTWEGYKEIAQQWSHAFNQVKQTVSNQLIGFTSSGTDLEELTRYYAGIDELNRATKARKQHKLSANEKARRKKQQELDKKKPNRSTFPKGKRLPGR